MSVQEAKRPVKTSVAAITEGGRGRREAAAVQLRKQQRDDDRSKRRLHDSPTTPQSHSGSDAGMAAFEQQPAWTLQVDAVERIQGMFAPDPAVQLDAVSTLRALVLSDSPSFPPNIFVPATARLVELLGCVDNMSILREATWVLSIILSSSSDYTTLAIENNIIPKALSLCFCYDEDIRVKALNVLGNIGGESVRMRDVLLSTDCFARLLTIFDTDAPLSVCRQATWVLSNLCRGNPRPVLMIVAPAVPVFANLIFGADPQIVSDACWGLSYISDGSSERAQLIVEAGVNRQIVALMRHPDPKIHSPALKIVGNLLAGDENQTQSVINCGVISNLLHMMSSSSAKIRKETCWAFSNIAAGNHLQIESLIRSGAMKPLIRQMSAQELPIRREAVYTVCNFAERADATQLGELIHYKAIQGLCASLEIPDTALLIACLQAIHRLLDVGKTVGNDDGENICRDQIEECGGVDKLESLQRHQNEQIYRAVVDIIETFFDADEVEESPGCEFRFEATAGTDAFHFD